MRDNRSLRSRPAVGHLVSGELAGAGSPCRRGEEALGVIALEEVDFALHHIRAERKLCLPCAHETRVEILKRLSGTSYGPPSPVYSIWELKPPIRAPPPRSALRFAFEMPRFAEKGALQRG